MKAHNVHRAAREPIVLPPPSGASTYVPAGATAAEVAAMLAEAHPVQARKPARRRRVVAVEAPRPAPPHEVLHEGLLVMSVPLRGDVANGRRFLIDLLAWERVKLLLGEGWTLKQPIGQDGPAYVVSGRVGVRATVRGGPGVVVLARWLVRAEPGTIVSYVTGDTLDLTGRDLAVVERREFWGRFSGSITHVRPGTSEFRTEYQESL